MTKQLRILIAEHHTQVIRAIRVLISEKTEHVIVGEVMDWDGLIKQIDRTKPDLILLDWDLPDPSESDHIGELCSLNRNPRVIVLSTRIEAKEKALAAGADAFVRKGDAPEKLLEVLH